MIDASVFVDVRICRLTPAGEVPVPHRTVIQLIGALSPLLADSCRNAALLKTKINKNCVIRSNLYFYYTKIL